MNEDLLIMVSSATDSAEIETALAERDMNRLMRGIAARIGREPSPVPASNEPEDPRDRLLAITANVPWKRAIDTTAASPARLEPIDSQANAGMREVLDRIGEARDLEWQRDEAAERDAEHDADDEPETPADNGSGTVGSMDSGVLSIREGIFSSPPNGENHRSAGFVDSVDANWGPPVPVGPQVPEFPTERLGAARPIVEAVATTYQVPADLPALCVLAAIATALGGRRTVRVNANWAEALVLFAIPLLPSGERKSPVVDFCKGPLLEAQKELTEKELKTYSERVQHHRMLTRQMEKAEERAASASDPDKRDQATADAIALREELDRLGPVPSLPQLTCTDETPENLARVVAEQGSRIAFLLDEAGLLGTLAGRYSKLPNLDLVLTGYRGGPYRVGRAGSGVVDIPAAHITLLLCAQNEMMRGIAANGDNRFAASGLLARPLYAMPAPMVGRRSVEDVPIPERTARDYRQRLKKLVTDVWDVGEPKEITLSDGASKLLRNYRSELEARQHQVGDLGRWDRHGWSAKLVGNLIRVAGLLTLFEDPNAAHVPEGRMRDSLAMSEYFIAHGKNVFALMNNSGREGETDPVRIVLAHLKKRADAAKAANKDPDAEFSLNEVQKALEGQKWVKDGGADAVREALGSLVEHGWARKLPNKKGPGRPSEKYLPHPWIANPPGASTKSTKPRDADGDAQSTRSEHVEPGEASTSHLAEIAPDNPRKSIKPSAEVGGDPSEGRRPLADDECALCGLRMDRIYFEFGAHPWCLEEASQAEAA